MTTNQGLSLEGECVICSLKTDLLFQAMHLLRQRQVFFFEDMTFIRKASFCNHEIHRGFDYLKTNQLPLVAEENGAPSRSNANRLVSPKPLFPCRHWPSANRTLHCWGHHSEQFKLYLDVDTFQPSGTDQFWAWYQPLRGKLRVDLLPIDTSAIVNAENHEQREPYPLERLNQQLLEELPDPLTDPPSVQTTGHELASPPTIGLSC